MKLFIALPMHQSAAWQTEMSVNEVMRKGLPGVNIVFKRLQGESNVVEARNILTALFLRSDCEKMLFIDSDMVFRPSQIARLISHEEPVVGGVYVKKKPGPPDYCCMGPPGQERGVADARGLIEVERMGTGLLCIHRSVFEQMEAALDLDHYWTERGEQTDFWFIEHFAGKDGKFWYHGEDYAWCARWRALGGKIWADAQVLAGHVGKMIFPEGWAEMMEFGDRPGAEGKAAPPSSDSGAASPPK